MMEIGGFGKFLFEDQGITRVVIVPLHLSHFIFKINSSEKILRDRESNRGPSVPQPRALSTELRQICLKLH